MTKRKREVARARGSVFFEGDGGSPRSDTEETCLGNTSAATSDSPVSEIGAGAGTAAGSGAGSGVSVLGIWASGGNGSNGVGGVDTLPAVAESEAEADDDIHRSTSVLNGHADADADADANVDADTDTIASQPASHISDDGSASIQGTTATGSHAPAPWHRPD